MATHDYVLANQSGSSFRTDLNNALAAIVSGNSSGSEPSTTYAYMIWNDTSNALRKIRNSSNNGWVTLSTLSGGSVFDDDVTFTGASYDALWDKSANSLIFNDNAKAIFGTSSDGVEIFHDGSNSRIKDTGTGSLKLSGNEVAIENAGTTETMATFTESGAVKLYYAGSTNPKIETTSGGAAVTGSFVADSFTFTGDTDTVIDNSAANTIQIKTNGVERLLINNFGTHIGANLYSNGKNIALGDSASIADDRLTLGDSQDIQIYHDDSVSSGTSFIDNATNELRIRSQYIALQPEGGGAQMLYGTQGGSVDLYYDGASKMATTTDGISLAGGADGTISELRLAEGNATTKIATIKGYSDGTNEKGIEFKTFHYHADTAIKCTPQNTEIYYDGSKKFETTSSGITVQGTVTETSDVSLKNDIKTITNPLEMIEQIRGINFTWKNNGIKSMGVIAQDVEKVFPELVHGTEGSKTLQYSGLIGALVESVKELSAKVAALESN